jgi:hypothetical protein
MTKQEEIREGLEKIALFCGSSEPDVCAGEMIMFLHKKGVAIVRYPARGEDLTGCAIVKVEPLVKE